MNSITEGIVCVQFRVLCALLILVGSIYTAFMDLFFGGFSKSKIPRTEDPLFRKSAKQIACEIRQKKMSCYDVVKCFITRQQEVNPVINAIVAERYNDALAEAKEVDEFLATTKLSEDELATQKPLLGVPLTVKESLSLKGMNLVVGSKERVGMKAEEHGECVRRVIEAGAIPLCVTTTPEYCLSTETNNLVTGRTNNPYNVSYTPGGSSGGEGALISSAGSVCGIGSDIAGSIRLPAAFCGIFGHKPTTGVTKLKGHVPYTEDPVYLKHLAIGPIGRYSEDLPLLMKVLTDDNPALKLDEHVKISNLKFYYMVDSGSCFGSMSVHETIKRRIRDAVDHFRRKFDCTISDHKFDEVQFVNEANTALFLSIEGEPMPDVNVFWQTLKTICNRGDYSLARLFYIFLKNDKLLLPADIHKIRDFVGYLEKKIDLELGSNGVFLYPTFPTGAFRHGASFFNATSLSYLSLANILGLPATSVPCGFTENGLPIGIQVIAGRFQDRLCMAVAKELEDLFGGWMPPY